MRSYAVLAALAVAFRRDPVQSEDIHAVNAESAAHVAAQAARVSNQVADHATDMHLHAQEALRHAHSALHEAQDAEGMTAGQHESLKKADTELKIATKKLEADELEQSEWVQDTLQHAAEDEQAHAATKQLEKQLADLEVKISIESDPVVKSELENEVTTLKHKLDVEKTAELKEDGYLESMGKMKDDLTKMKHQVETMNDINELRDKINGLEPGAPQTFGANLSVDGVGTPSIETTTHVEVKKFARDLDELQEMLKGLEYQHEQGAPDTNSEELAKELARLRTSIAEAIQRQEKDFHADHVARTGDFVPVGVAGTKPVHFAPESVDVSFPGAPVASQVATPVAASRSSLDIDTEMPFGELEPFGREDTASELTEAAIHESDKMVDQIEKAEVAEEKRAVFRALTRLRGAAITSYDGVARSQTGNIDEYNHLHKWRETHPLHHLADEEADVSKWAFPDNAD